MNRVLVCVALGMFPLTALSITVDGTVDAEYGPPIVVQTVQTQFGDASPPANLAGSELDAAYAVVEGGRLYVILTGNLETNFNKLDVFIDSKPGGENTLSATPDYDFFNPGGCGGAGCWISTNMQGLTFDAGFEADYHLFASWGGGSSPGGLGVTFVDRQGGGSAMVAGSEGTGAAAVGLISLGSIPAGAVGPNASGTALSQILDFAINANNAAGVTGGTAAADQVAAAMVTTGMEFSIALADLGNPTNPGTIVVSAMINNGDHNFLSNQILGGLPAPQGNLGGDGGGGFTGDLSGVDFGSFAGSQNLVISPVPVELMSFTIAMARPARAGGE